MISWLSKGQETNDLKSEIIDEFKLLLINLIDDDDVTVVDCRSNCWLGDCDNSIDDGDDDDDDDDWIWSLRKWWLNDDPWHNEVFIVLPE